MIKIYILVWVLVVHCVSSWKMMGQPPLESIWTALKISDNHEAHDVFATLYFFGGTACWGLLVTELVENPLS